MRKIKINYCDYPLGYNFKDDLIYKILSKKYDVDICDNPDYVFYSCFGFEHLNISNECVTIFVSGEDECPNFNLCDYGIGFEYLNYGDRYFRFPLYYFYPEENKKMERKHILPDNFSIKKEKPYFCSFVVSNANGSQLREKMFNLLSQYKLVNSGGKFKNNVGGPIVDKYFFDSKHKFSICFENTNHSGYTTEKIMQAFSARTVPIYWGDPDINKIFNPKSFINVMDFNSIEDVVKEVVKVDNDDYLYLNMLRQPVYLDDHNTGYFIRKKLEVFLFNIIEQPKKDAYRRSRIFHQVRYKYNRQFLYNRSRKLDKYLDNVLVRSFRNFLAKFKL